MMSVPPGRDREMGSLSHSLSTRLMVSTSAKYLASKPLDLSLRFFFLNCLDIKALVCYP